MIANLASIDFLELLGVETTQAFPQNAPSPQEFAKSLREAMARPRPDPARTIQGARPPEARRDGPGFRPVFLRDRPTQAPPPSPRARTKNEADPSPLPSRTSEADNSPRDDESTVSGQATPNPVKSPTDPQAHQDVLTPTDPDGVPTDLTVPGDTSTDPDERVPDAARRLLEHLAMLLQKLQEIKDDPEARQALLAGLQQDPTLGQLLDLLTEATGQTLPDLLANHSPEQVFEPLQKVLTLLTAPEPPLPEAFGQALEQAFQDNPLWKDVNPETAARAVEDLLATALPASTSGATDPALPAPETISPPAQSVSEASEHPGKSAPKAHLHGRQAPATEGTDTALSTPTGSAEPAAPSPDRTRPQEQPTPPHEEDGRPASAIPPFHAPSPTVAAADAVGSALTAEEATPPSPARKPAFDPAAPAADLKGPRAAVAPPTGGQPSQGWGFNPGDRPPEKIGPPPPRSADPIRGALFSQIIEKAELFKVGTEKKVLTIQLRPESLGKLNIELTSKDGTVSARITTEHAMVREKLDQLVPQIKDTLAAQGIKLDQVTVDISHQNPEGRKEQAFPGQGGTFRSSSAPTQEEAGPIQDVRPALRRLALNIRMVDLTV